MGDWGCYFKIAHQRDWNWLVGYGDVSSCLELKSKEWIGVWLGSCFFHHRKNPNWSSRCATHSTSEPVSRSRRECLVSWSVCLIPLFCRVAHNRRSLSFEVFLVVAPVDPNSITARLREGPSWEGGGGSRGEQETRQRKDSWERWSARSVFTSCIGPVASPRTTLVAHWPSWRNLT